MKYLSSAQAFEVLDDLLPRNGICLAVKATLTKDSGVASAGVYDQIVLKLLSKRNAKGRRQFYWVFVGELREALEKVTKRDTREALAKR